MLVLGVTLIICGIVSSCAGIVANNDPISVGLSYLSGRGSNPGLIWIIAGITALAAGTAVLIVKKIANSKETPAGRKGVKMISGIISLIALGFLFIAAGSMLVFIGMQINNAFNHAWDLFLSYLSVASIDSNSGTVFMIIGIIVGIIGICFMVIGILEAMKVNKAKPGAVADEESKDS